MTLVISMHHIAMHPENNNAPLTNHGSPKAFYLPSQKRILSAESSWLQATQILLDDTKLTENMLTHLKEISKQTYYKQAFQNCHHDIKNMEACQWSNCNKKQISTK